MGDDRLATLWAGLEELGCEALLVLARSSQDPDLAPFVGDVHLGESQLVIPKGGPARLAYFTPMEREEAASTGLDLITPEHLDMARWQSQAAEPDHLMAWVAEKSLEAAGISPGRVALAGHGQAGVIQAAFSALARKGWTWVAGNPILLAVRKSKSAAELAGIREAADGVSAALRRVASRLAACAIQDGELWLDGERLTVARLRSEVAQVLAAHGLEQPKGNILAPGEEGGVPHSTGTPERVLRAGESLVVDLFPRGALFADCTRTFCVGEPPEGLRRAHALVLAALERAHLRSQPGVRGWAIQEEICDIFDAEGFPTQISTPGTTRGYVHNLGHGVGFDLHEHPIFRKAAGAEGVLREGDVFTLEPGLYEPNISDGGGYGVRLEDLVYLGPEGLENLTPLPYDLDPRIWE